MNKIFIILFYFGVICCASGFCAENTIDSEIFSANSQAGYFIIKAGHLNGVEKGDNVSVYRQGKKIAEATVTKVRPEVSAAQISTVTSSEKIMAGDSVLIIKKNKPVAQKREKPSWARWPLLKPRTSEISKSEITRPKPGEYKTVRIEPDQRIIKSNVNANRDIVFTMSLQVLIEDGYSIILSNRAAGIITAVKHLNLPLLSELWADATAALDHKIVISLDINDKDGYREVVISGFKEYFKKGRQIKLNMAKDSTSYKNLVYIASKIKERSERIEK